MQLVGFSEEYWNGTVSMIRSLAPIELDLPWELVPDRLWYSCTILQAFQLCHIVTRLRITVHTPNTILVTASEGKVEKLSREEDIVPRIDVPFEANDGYGAIAFAVDCSREDPRGWKEQFEFIEGFTELRKRYGYGCVQDRR